MPVAVLAACLAATAGAQEDLLFFVDGGTPISDDALETRSINVADVDNDGDADVFVGNHDADNGLFLNDGQGAFTADAANVVASDGGDTMGADFGDIDGDGDLDLAVANSIRDGVAADELNRLYVNETNGAGPAGAFTKVVSGDVVTDGGDTYCVGFADIDSDGDLDLLFVNRNEANFLYEGDGAGGFTRVTTGDLANDDANKTRDIAFGDLDGDGDVDIAMANSNLQDNDVWVNQGNAQGGTEGDFERLQGDVAVTSGGDSFTVAIADVDADGLLDLFVGNKGADRVGAPDELYFGAGQDAAGNPTFTQDVGADPTLGATSTYGSVFADLEDDGDADLVVTRRFGQDNAVFLNVDGVLTAVTGGDAVTSGGNTTSVVAADLDGDDNREILYGNTTLGVTPETDVLLDNQGLVFKDLGSALAGNTEPVLFGTGDLVPNTAMTLEVEDGPPNGAGGIFYSVQLLLTPLKGGTLVPAPDFILPTVLDGSGGLVINGIWPDLLPPQTTVFFQEWAADASAPQGFSATNGLSATSQ